MWLREHFRLLSTENIFSQSPYKIEYIAMKFSYVNYLVIATQKSILDTSVFCEEYSTYTMLKVTCKYFCLRSFQQFHLLYNYFMA